MQFEFATSNRVIFGVGAAKETAKYAGIFGRRVLLVAEHPVRRKGDGAQPRAGAPRHEAVVVEVHADAHAEPAMIRVERAISTVTR